MAETFAETLDRIQRQRRAAQAVPVSAPSSDLPTDYGQRAIPDGMMVDADTYRQGAETFRVAGLDAPELKDRRTGALIPEGQEAYARSAAQFQAPVRPERTGVDLHGRTVARPVTADGRDLGAEMVRRGDAVPKDWNRSGTLPYAREAAARFDEVNPPSEAAKAMAEYQGGTLDGGIRIAPEKNPRGRGYLEEAGAGLKRGIDQAQSGLYGAVSLMGKLVADDSRGSDPLTWKSDDPRLTLRDRISNWLQRTGNTGVMRNDEQAAQNPAAYNFEDVREGKADLLQWALGVLGEAAPSTAIMGAAAIATGGVGALVGRAAGSGALGVALEQSAIKAAESAATTAIRRSLLERGVAPILAQTAARNIAADPVKYARNAYAARAAFAGGWAGSAALEGGHMWSEGQQELGPEADPRYALAGGLAAGLLDTGAMMVVAKPFMKAFSTPAAGAALEQVAGSTLGEKLAALTGAVLKGSLRGIAAEAPTETMQELLAVASVEAQKDSPIPLVERLQSPEYINRYLEAGAAGFVFGGAFGSVGGGFQHATRRTATPPTPQDASDATSADAQSPLGVGDAMPVGDQLQGGVNVPTDSLGTNAPLDSADLAQAAHNGVLADPQPPADLDNADAVGKQRRDTVDVNVDSVVNPEVVAAAQNDEVARRVIESVPVKVMDMLGFKERTPENFAHNKAVLLRSLAPSSDPSVRFFQLFVSQTLASSLKGSGASLGAADVGGLRDVAGLPEESGATIGVGTDANRHSSTPLDQDTKGVGDAVPPASPVPSSIPLKRGESIVLRPGATRVSPVDPITQIPPVKAKQILYMLGHSTRDDADIARITGVDPALIARIRAAQGAPSAPTTAAPIGPVLDERGAPEPYQPQQPLAPSASKSQIRRLQRGESVVLRPGATEAEAKPLEAPAAEAPPVVKEPIATQQEEAPPSSSPAPAPLSDSTRVTPDKVTSLQPNEVFVFGSNRAGIHGKGGALQARREFGAQLKRGEGQYGQSYALPTKERPADGSLPLDAIAEHVRTFTEHARNHPETRFLVTALGTGLAGNSVEQIAPLFVEAAKLPNVALPKSFWDAIGVSPSSRQGEAPPSSSPPAPSARESDRADIAGAPTASASPPAPVESAGSSRASDTPTTGKNRSGVAPTTGEQLAFYEGAEAPPFRRGLLNPLSLDGAAPIAARRSAPQPSVATQTPVTRTPMTPEALRDSEVRHGLRFAQQLKKMWADLLGVERVPVDVTVEQVKALAGSDQKMRYYAALKLARDYAKTFVADRWTSAGEETRKKVQEAYKRANTRLDFDAWLAREVGDVLLNDAHLRQLYADANLGLAYRWLRKVGTALAKLASSFLTRFTDKVEASPPAVTEFVRNLVDHRRTELAERNGLSPESTRLFKEATNRLAGGTRQAQLLDDLEQRLVEDRAGPLYKRWLAALRRVQAALDSREGADPSLLEPVQDALRAAIERADPLWRMPGPRRRRLLRERASDELRALPAVRRAGPDAADAIEEIARLATEIEDALAMARSFAGATEALTPTDTTPVRQTGRALADLLAESEHDRVVDRTVARAFLAAVQRPAEVDARGEFDAQFKKRAKDNLIARFRDALTGRAKLAEELRANDEALAGSKARTLVATLWKGLGFAVEDTPRVVPVGEIWARIGVQIDSEQNLLEEALTGVGDYAAETRLMEMLPAAHRDALARAYEREGSGDSVQWFGEQLATALRSDPVIWQALYRTTPETASDAEAQHRLTEERHTYNGLLAKAVRATEFAAPEVVEALRYRLRARYGRETIDRAEAALGKARSPLHAWYLLALGYSETENGKPAFSKARADAVKDLLKRVRALFEHTPGIDAADPSERAAFLLKNLPDLLTHRPAFQALAPGDDMARSLVDWVDSLDPSRHEDGASPGEAVEEDPEARLDEVEDEEAWMARAVEEGASIVDGAELRQEIEEASERKVVLENTLALMSEYSPSVEKVSAKTGEKYMTAPGLYRRFQVIDGAQSPLLNSDQATSFASDLADNEKFEADIGDANFRALPTDVQHVLLQRAQVLSRMGASAEYRLARHTTEAGREVRYIAERVALSDRATLHVSPLKDGSVVSDQLLIDRVRAALETSNRYTSRWAAESKYGSNRDRRFGAIDFDVRAALDHPLLSRLVEALDRDSTIGGPLRELAADYAMIPEDDLLQQAQAMLPALRQSIEADPALHQLMTQSGDGFAQLIVAALGYDQALFFNDYSDSLKDPSLRPHERPTQTRSNVFVDPETAKVLGLAPQRGKSKGSKPGAIYYALNTKGGSAADGALAAFLRLFVAGYDPTTNTLKTGVRATVSADALVGVGGKTLTGLEGSPNTNFDRVHRLYRGFDLATQLPNPWVPADPFWASWHGLNSKKLENDPHMDLIVFKSPEETITLGEELTYRKIADILQGDGTEHISTREKSMGELDEDIQYWKARLEHIFQRVDARIGEKATADEGVYDEQATTDYGTPVWSFTGVIPAEILATIKTVRIGERTAVPWRFSAKQGLTLKVGDTTYTARPFSVLEEIEHSQSRIGALRHRINELRAILKYDGYVNEQRGLSGSELNYYQHVEEELGRLEARIDQMGLGNYAARVNQEQKLFNPDLNSAEVQWNADFKGHQYEGLKGLTVPGERKGKGDAVPEVKDLPPPTARLSDVLHRFVAQTAAKLGLDARDVRLSAVDLAALKAAGKDSRTSFDDVMRDYGYAELAESVWQHAVEEPVFVVFDNGKPHIIAFDADLRTGEKLSAEYLKDAVAHEMGHVYFREKVAPRLKTKRDRNALVEQLKEWNPEWNFSSNLLIEEAVAEVIRAKIVGEEAPSQKQLGNQTVLSKLVAAVKKAWTDLFGTDEDALSPMAEHNAMRASQLVARHLSGRKLLTGPVKFGKGAWDTMKDLYDAVVRTTHSWLRAQRGRDGKPLASFQLLADILRWTPGRSPQTRALGGQLFDFTTAGGNYHQSYEQAITREFARYGHRVEAMLDSWAPARERAAFWDAKKRAEIAEAQRVRQVEAVRDFVAGRDTRGAQDLRQFFADLGQYFGPVLKRYDPAKSLPRIFNQEVLRERKADFLALLGKNGVEGEEAERTYSILTLEQGSDYRNDAGQFFAPHFQRARMGDRLDAIADADLLPFLLIDSQPQAALWQYVHQAVKRTEFERRFGGWVYFDGAADFTPSDTLRPRLLTPEDAERMRDVAPTRNDRNQVVYELTRSDGKTQRVLWDQTAKYRLLRTIAAEDGASQAQLGYLLKTMEAELGRYGANFSPRIRAAQSALIAGMNWAVLPLSLTSQFTDLALPLLRSNGDFRAAWKGMKAAVAELRKAGDLTLAAKTNGVLAGNLRDYFASAYLDTPFLSAGAQKWNNRLFKYNGMEKATEFVRLFAFATGKEWIKSLAARNTAEASAQLEQLGLTRDDVAAWVTGQEKLDTGEGGLDDASERVQQALNAFVEQSMFRPSASQRPVWGSHPAAQLVWYLKSYIWAYADTILSRTGREFQRLDSYGQKALILALPALFMVPLAALGLMLRDEFRDELAGALPWRKPKREQDEDATDYAMRLIGRTGLLGPLQTLVDAGRAQEYGSPYYLSLIGPFATMADQMMQRVSASGGGQTAKGAADALLRITPLIGALPGERRALVDWAF